MKCPKCKLINPEGALRCDCGYDFPSGTVQQSYLQPAGPRPSEAIREAGRAELVRGVLIGLLGLIFSAGSYLFARDTGSGTYFIASGAILLGLVKVIRGADRIRTGLDRSFWGQHKNTLDR